MELTQENLDKLLSENENYKSALSEERSKRKTAEKKVLEVQWEIEDFQKTKSDLEKKNLDSKWTYDSLIAQKDKEIEEAKSKLDALEWKATKYDEFTTKTLEEKVGKIPEEKRDFVNKVLWDKTLEEKLELLDWFIEDYSKKDFSNKPWGQWKDPSEAETKLDEAKKKWDIRWVIANAKVVQVTPPTT